MASRPMRPLLLLMLLGVVSAPGVAQDQRSGRAFELAISPSVGMTSFGTRHTSNELEAKYRSSVWLSVRGELPLTQRFGLLGSVAVSPASKQRVANPVSTDLHERVTLYRADAALGWRFIPRAPVFFFGGAGVMRGSLPAYPGFDQFVTESRGMFGFGYDHPSAGRWNFRVTATGYLSRPEDPDLGNWVEDGPVQAVTTKSTVLDWGIEFGGRYRLRRGS